MSRTDNNELIQKALLLAHSLGKKTSLISSPETSVEHYIGFKNGASRVRNMYRTLVDEVSEQKHLTYEVESILDNFFVVESAIFEIKNNLRKQDFKKLPLIKTSGGKSVPRLYYILSKLVEETNEVLNRDTIKEFLLSYQEHSPLSIRELYAIPAILQIIFVEHFGKFIDRAIVSLEEYEAAGFIAKKIMKEIGKNKQHNFSSIISELADKYSIVPLSLGFHLFQRLSAEASVMRPVIKWLKLNFEKQGINIKEISELESKQRSASSVTASNIIESMHWLTQARWENLVEEINIVDNILSKDPAGAYPLMDMESKNNYRQVIVRIAETSSIHEAEVARTAVRLASGAKVGLLAEGHVGYYLIDKGRMDLESRIDYRPTNKDILHRFVTGHASKVYFGGALALNSILTAVLLFTLSRFSVNAVTLSTVGVFGFFFNLEISFSFLNILIGRFLSVRKLPGLDLSKGISDKQKTFVVIPTMMRSAKAIKETVRKLEVRYLANQEDNILYALLFDFKDADSENLPGDNALVDAAFKEIEKLNSRYATREKKFYFLYRRRVWNESEGKFMGWERKRGKLREFNTLLRGATGTTYVNEFVLASIPHVRYVITLDEDTELPQDAARKLIGCIDHPLNQPVFNTGSNQLARGYGIIQPRAGVRIAISAKSLYSRLYSVNSGIDSYSTAVSDVYQDLFGNAIFFGKGIYDVDTVERTMAGEIPENTVLSHDLLEGIYARTGYASSIVLFDGFPNYYHEFATRLHRWIRGDWQIISWLSSRGKNFSVVDKFKIFDNLRRSLVPVVGLFFIILGFSYLPIASYLSVYVCIVLAAPSILSFINDILSFKRIPARIRFNDTLRQLYTTIAHSFLRGIFLIHQAGISISAVLVTINRLFITKKHLLEWQNSTDVGIKFNGRIREFYRTMIITQIFPALYFLYINYEMDASVGLLWFSFAWFVSPIVGYLISRSHVKEEKVNKSDERMLRSIAYRTARYFLDLSRKENNWLIQDHYQEFPKISQTDRLTTSPTNLGMLFASLFSSYELGFLSFDHFLDRTRRAFASLSKLDRYKGHLYNWYDIETLEPLVPTYLSSVDSANFVMALIAFRQGIQGLVKRKIVDSHSIRGIEDGLYSIIDETKSLRKTVGNKNARVIAASISLLAETAIKNIAEIKTLKTFSDFYKLFTSIHPLIVAIERKVIDLREDESVKGADQVFFFVEHLSKLIEGELAFQRYLLPHIHSRDHSIDTHISRDEKLFAVYSKFITFIDEVPSLWDIAYFLSDKVRTFDFLKAIQDSNLLPQSKEYVLAWYEGILKDLTKSESRAKEFIGDIDSIITDCNRFINEPDFGFLYNKERGLFHIGYNVTYDRVDNACYNFLASESNSVSFVAIYKNQIPVKHWFYLSRKLVHSGGKVGLVSWGGSLFEYLTSLLYFKVHDESLLGTTAQSAISIHRRHGFLHRIPWGMGESAYYLFDAGKHYQYQVFGSPALGLKRGLADYMVIAPYVSALSLSFALKAAVVNMRRMIGLGGLGNFGFFDALDYMNEYRVKTVHPMATKIYYAHHQGFALLGIHNVLEKDRIRNLFHGDQRVASLEVLLEEKMPPAPAATTLSVPTRLPFTAAAGVNDNGTESKQYIPIKTPYPYVALLGNGTYSTTVSNAGAGSSKYKNVTLNNFKDDSLLEESGTFFYIRNEKTKTLWSPTIRPLGGDSKKHKVIFHENKAEFHSSNGFISTRIEVAIDPELSAEVRVLSVLNNGSETERLTIASYGEVSLASQSEDAHHPQYQKLLVSSEFVPEFNALVYSRAYPGDRTRKINFAHMLAQEGMFHQKTSACADREVFIGRSRSFKDPAFFDRTHNEEIRKYTLDPVFSLSRTIDLKPGDTQRLVFVSMAHENKDDLMDMVKKFKRGRAGVSVVNHSLTNSAKSTQELGITQDMAVAFQTLASRALGGKQNLPSDLPSSPLPLIHSLWKLGISGDYPIVVVIIKDIEDIQTVKHALLCHMYWKHKRINIDLVILNQEPASYIKVLDDEIDFLLRQSRDAKAEIAGGRIHHIKSDLTEEADKKVLLYVARAVLNTKDGTFKQQIKTISKSPKVEKYPAKHIPTSRAVHLVSKKETALSDNLSFKNSWGGFDVGTSEYVMAVNSYNLPLAPWSNIIATPEFGTVVTEAGSMFTWSKDSYDNRITAWQNDPLVFKSSEIFYIRDEETGEVWNPTPMPIRTRMPFIVRHGKGYTVFEHTRGMLSISLHITVSQEHPIKIATLKIKNNGTKRKTISETVFLNPAMNVFRDHTRDFINFERDADTNALIFKQGFRNQLPNRVAFADLCSGSFDVTTDKAEFLGRHGSYESPAAMKRVALSNNIMLGTINCAVLQSVIEINPGEEKEVIFSIGEADSLQAVQEIVKAYRDPQKTHDTGLSVSKYWNDLSKTIQINTPDKELDAMFNNQLIYQLLSSRIWAKTGFYQPSGAFGFRDQLQDMSAMIWSAPAMVRAFILNAAAHQFKEGDALNWWHEHNNFGARSVLSDHQLWLVNTTIEYVTITGDEKILDEEIPFLEGTPLNFAYQRNWAGTPKISSEKGTLYEHCVRALTKSSVLGEHGLPLIGNSDWNDGLSRAGILGKGESIWIGWFLGYLMNRFASIASKRGDEEKSKEYKSYSEALVKALEKHGWDGKWYRRAFLDSGIVLGSRKLNEFKIDSIAQSWAVISGLARDERKEKASHAMFTELFDGTNMKLLAPALQNSVFDPGYIKDYPPGVRENGSQYNHAALWAAQALFMQNEPDNAKKIIDLVNPFKRSNSPAKAAEYRVEPYVVASDVYAEPSYRGRGGWTWYTGSAGVMYRTILINIMGLNFEGNTLHFTPSLPTEWTTCSATYRKGKTEYKINYEKPANVKGKVATVYENGVELPEKKVTLVDDGKKHEIKITLEAF